MCLVCTPNRLLPEVHCPPGECHQDAGQGQRGEQATQPDHDGGDVGHAGGVMTSSPRGLHGHIVTGVVTEHGRVPRLREHGVKDGDAVGTDDADPAKLLDLILKVFRNDKNLNIKQRSFYILG